MLNLISVLPQVEAMADAQQRAAALAAFQAKYSVTWTRTTFTANEPNADGTFVLTPDCDDPLPPVGCKVKVYDYNGMTYQTVVIDVNEANGTYTVVIKDE